MWDSAVKKSKISVNKTLNSALGKWNKRPNERFKPDIVHMAKNQVIDLIMASNEKIKQKFARN